MKTDFDTFYKRYYTTVKTIANYVLKNECDAEEVADDIFMGLLKYTPEFDKTSKDIDRFLYRITINRAIDKYRTRREYLHYDTVFYNAIDQNTLMDEILIKDAEDKFIKESIDKLTYVHKKILTKRYINNLSVKDLAKEYNVPESNIVSKISKAKAKLREILNNG